MLNLYELSFEAVCRQYLLRLSENPDLPVEIDDLIELLKQTISEDFKQKWFQIPENAEWGEDAVSHYLKSFSPLLVIQNDQPSSFLNIRILLDSYPLLVF